jgi:triosephosphate isomerase
MARFRGFGERPVRVPLVAGNWKMNKDLAGARALARGVREALGDRPEGVEVALIPPFPFLLPVAEALAGSEIALGAQDCYPEPEGAFTGAVSCEMLRSCGVRYVICGHSERRRIFGEDDGLVNRKVRAALATGLCPIVCVGETDAERSHGRTMAVVSQQLSLGLDGLTGREAAPLVIAYEPVWAIGTGKNARPEQIEEVHRFIRGTLVEQFGAGIGAGIRIQYGGSVKAANAAEIFAASDVDGALVGGASLEAAGFAAIVRAASKKTKEAQKRCPTA